MRAGTEQAMDFRLVELRDGATPVCLAVDDAVPAMQRHLSNLLERVHALFTGRPKPGTINGHGNGHGNGSGNTAASAAATLAEELPELVLEVGHVHVDMARLAGMVKAASKETLRSSVVSMSVAARLLFLDACGGRGVRHYLWLCGCVWLYGCVAV